MTRRHWFLAALVLALLLLLAGDGARHYDRAQVRVIDGDTLHFGRWWPERVRLAGIDAPELHGYRCPLELVMAQTVRQRAVRLVKAGAAISRRHGTDRYGRTIADVRLTDGRDLATSLAESDLVRACTAPCPRIASPWCPNTAEKRTMF